MEKKCSKCGEVKEFSQFKKDTRNRSGYQASCKACASKYMVIYYSTTPRGQYHRLQDSADSSDKPFLITSDEFVGWWLAQKLNCHYCSQPLTRSFKSNHRLTDMTIDRTDNVRGYTIDNIVLACRRCNLMKGSWLTEKQTLEIAQRYFKPDISQLVNRVLPAPPC